MDFDLKCYVQGKGALVLLFVRRSYHHFAFQIQTEVRHCLKNHHTDVARHIQTLSITQIIPRYMSILVESPCLVLSNGTILMP